MRLRGAMRLAPVAERSPGVQIAGQLRQPSRDLDLDRDDTDRTERLLGGPGGMVSAATTHSGRRTAPAAERLRVELAVLQLRSDFVAGDFVGGLTRGIAMLAEHARPQHTLHAGS